MNRGSAFAARRIVYQQLVPQDGGTSTARTCLVYGMTCFNAPTTASMFFPFSAATQMRPESTP
jgi:hypothetical protein